MTLNPFNPSPRSKDVFLTVVAFIAIFVLAAVVLILFSSVQLHASHGDDWISKGGYKSPVGTSCCGLEDCKVLPSWIVVYVNGFYYFEWKGKTRQVPEHQALLSHDHQYHVCDYSDGSTRCFFRPSSGV